MSYYPGQPLKTASQASRGRQNYFPSFSDSMFDPFSFGDSTRDMIEQQHPHYKHQQEQAQRRQMAEQQQRENELRRQQLQRNQQEAALRRHLHNQQQQEAAYQKQQEGYQKQREAALLGGPGTSNKAAKRRARRQRQAKESGHQDPIKDIATHSFFQPDEQKDSMNDIGSLVEAAFGDGSSSHKSKSNSSRKHQERPGPSQHRQPQSRPQSQPQSQPHHQPHRRQHQRPQEEKKVSEEDEKDEGEEVEDEEEQVSTPETSSMETSDEDQDTDQEEEEEQEQQEQPHPQSEKRHAELEAIEKNLDELEVELEQILAGHITKKKQILMTEEMLTKAMLKVDSVESEGDWSIRKRRKSLINRCESLLERVDGYKRQHREELRL
ncbi:hypothetical protein BG000_003225 [Podila horticola]|nr:hypothetical protein BG000_003225 [Podila horticola]